MNLYMEKDFGHFRIDVESQEIRILIFMHIDFFNLTPFAVCFLPCCMFFFSVLNSPDFASWAAPVFAREVHNSFWHVSVFILCV